MPKLRCTWSTHNVQLFSEKVYKASMLAVAVVLALANLPNGTQNQSYLCRITQGSQRSMVTYCLVSLKTLCQFLPWTWIQL